ncbi:MAG: VTT domain-containing protein [Candidatus Gracilibacteria bacterium]
MFSKLIDLILHADKFIGPLLEGNHLFVYLFLFIIIFVETGLVIMPFLPGDSLLFIAGTFAAGGFLDIYLLLAILCVAAVVGDTVNYYLGKVFGEKLFSKFINPKHMAKTREFYEKYGKKTIVIARFIPIVRTFAPFVAGIGKMNYLTFLNYNIIGGVSWVLVFLMGGFIFGNIPFVKENLSLIVLGIIFASMIPVAIEYLRTRSRKA